MSLIFYVYKGFLFPSPLVCRKANVKGAIAFGTCFSRWRDEEACMVEATSLPLNNSTTFQRREGYRGMVWLGTTPPVSNLFNTAIRSKDKNTKII